MIVTREQQLKLVREYVKKNHTLDGRDGFIDGINETLKLIDKLMKDETKELGQGNVTTITEKKGRIEVDSTIYNDETIYQGVTLDTELEEARKQQYINLLKRL